MPDGVLQWLDPTADTASVVRAGKRFAARVSDLESRARVPGAHVEFDIRRDDGVDRAVNVRLRAGTRVSHRQRDFGTLAGARGADTKGPAPFARPHPERGLSLASHPLEVVTAWASALADGDADAAASIYAPDAIVHDGERSASGARHVAVWLQRASLLGAGRRPTVRGEDGTVVARWEGPGGAPDALMRFRVAHGLITEQWVETRPDEGSPSPAPEREEGAAVHIAASKGVPDEVVEYARGRLGSLLERVGEPVLFARGRLGVAPDPARERPARAQATLEVNGVPVRAQVAAHAPREAVDLLVERLKDKLEHLAERREATRRLTGEAAPGEWRHGYLPTVRPDFFDRAVDDRELVRHKSFAVEEATPDEAVFDMEQLDFAFYLFRDLASGTDSLMAATDAGYRMQRVGGGDADLGPTAAPVQLSPLAPPTLTVDEAVRRLNDGQEPFVFFANATTGRGNVVYRRYDGHYGLITPA